MKRGLTGKAGMSASRKKSARGEKPVLRETRGSEQRCIAKRNRRKEKRPVSFMKRGIWRLESLPGEARFAREGEHERIAKGTGAVGEATGSFYEARSDWEGGHERIAKGTGAVGEATGSFYEARSDREGGHERIAKGTGARGEAGFA